MKTCEEFTFVSTGQVVACVLPKDHVPIDTHSGKLTRKYWHSWTTNTEELKEPKLK